MMAQQELFTAVKLACERLGYAVYDGYMPPEGTPYPFIYIGEFGEDMYLSKRGIYGDLTVSVHVWGNNPKKRGEISEIMQKIQRILIRTEKTTNYSLVFTGANSKIIEDRTTSQPLLHGVVEAGYKFS